MNELQKKIRKLVKEKEAIILAHYYTNGEIQDIADYVGDSLGLSRMASTTDAKIILFCGVDFMGETAKILSPSKKVLMANGTSSCIMARYVSKRDLLSYKKNNPDTIIISYVNTFAEIKALSDVCVTSTNALNIIKYYADQGKKILYIPDKNLGNYANKMYNYNMELWNGMCPRHNNISMEDVLRAKKEHPNAKLLVHPECQYEIVKCADFAGSTKQLLDYSVNDECNEFIIGTESGVIYSMQKASPQKKFYPLVDNFTCADMKKIKLEDVYDSLVNEKNEVILDKDVSERARKALDKMLELSK